jgi:hypothetical protein
MPLRLLASPLIQNKPDFRGLVRRMRLGPLGAKIGVILLFTVCWLAVVLVRISNAPHDSISLEGSSLVALAGSLQHYSISGRDFQSMFGPGAQILASAAMSATKTNSPLHAWGMIAFFFSGASSILIAVMLLLCDRLTWLDSAIVYGFCFFLNLFFGVLDFRTALLLVASALAYRVTSAETMWQRVIWATITGLTCFYAQLVTFDLGIYAAVAVLGALAAGSLLTRNTDVLLGIEVVVATIAAANLELVAFFKWTSANYGLMFDYQSYAVEMLRTFHNSMGSLWELSTSHTMVLALVALYAIGASVIVVFRRSSDSLDASLFAGLILLSVIWLNTASVKSDVPHIMAAFTPMALLLALLATKVWESRQEGVAWVVVVVALLFVWPSFNVSAAGDLVRIASGRVPARRAVRNVYNAPLKAAPAPKWMTAELADQGNVATLSFPFGNHVAPVMGHPVFAPVLESYLASSEALENYYVQAIDKQPLGGLEIIFGPDRNQPITQTPDIFEYLYSHFGLVGTEDHTDGQYILRVRDQQRTMSREPIPFAAIHELPDRGMLKLATPSTCGLIRLQLHAEYNRDTSIFRPSGLELVLSDGDQQVWQGVIQPPEPNHTFTTYISPLPPATFHKVFGEGPIQTVQWNKAEYRPLPADFLGSRADLIRIEKMQCLDPQRFAGAAESQTPVSSSHS